MKRRFSPLLPFLLAVVFASAAAQEKCRTLVLEGKRVWLNIVIGGGDKGSYAAGAIQGFVHGLKPEERAWEIVSGVSIGAVNAFAISLFDVGREDLAADFMSHMWTGMQRNQLFKQWPHGIIESFTAPHSGLFDNSVVLEYLDKMVKEKSLKRTLTAGAVDANTGQYIRYNSTGMPYEDVLKVVQGSGAYPVAFPAVEFYGKNLIDGGVVLYMDFDAPIQLCRERGFRDEDIVLDTIFLTGDNLPVRDTSNFTPLQMHHRTKEIHGYLYNMGIYEKALLDYPDVDFRYVVAPEVSLNPSYEFAPILFNMKRMKRNKQFGYQDAIKAIAAGPEGQQFKKKILERIRF